MGVCPSVAARRRPGASSTVWRYRFSVRAKGDTPRQFADLNGFDDLQSRHVDHRDVIGDAVGHDKIFFVRRKSAVPDSLADQQVFQDGVSDTIDHRDPVGGAEIDEAELAVLGDVDADRLDCLGSQARNFELYGLFELARGRIDDREVAADLRAYP